MKSLFFESTLFEKYRESYLTDNEYRLFQMELMANPKQGAVIQRTGGLRKIRVGNQSKGNRGGSRVIYGKNELADLTSTQKKQLQAFMEAWRYEQS